MVTRTDDLAVDVLRDGVGQIRSLGRSPALVWSAVACFALLTWAGLDKPVSIDREMLREREIDRLSDCIEQHLDLSVLFPDWPAG